MYNIHSGIHKHIPNWGLLYENIKNLKKNYDNYFWKEIVINTVQVDIITTCANLQNQGFRPQKGLQCGLFLGATHWLSLEEVRLFHCFIEYYTEISKRVKVTKHQNQSSLTLEEIVGWLVGFSWPFRSKNLKEPVPPKQSE